MSKYLALIKCPLSHQLCTQWARNNDFPFIAFAYCFQATCRAIDFQFFNRKFCNNFLYNMNQIFNQKLFCLQCRGKNMFTYQLHNKCFPRGVHSYGV